MTTTRSRTSRASIYRGLIIAGLLLGASAAIKLLSPEHLSPELGRRLLGVLLGTVVVIYANAVPKALSRLMRMRDPIAEQATRRFVGWCLVLGGMAYAVTWMIAPLRSANVLAGILLAVALLLVVARVARGMFFTALFAGALLLAHVPVHAINGALDLEVRAAEDIAVTFAPRAMDLLADGMQLRFGTPAARTLQQ